MGLYKPPFFNEKNFLFYLNRAYNFFYPTYKNIILIDDFNLIPKNKKVSDFGEEVNKFEHLILKPNCFKALLPSTIDLL